MDPIFIYAALFVAALLVFDTVFRWVVGSRRTTTEVNSRLRSLAKSENQVTAYNELLKRRGIAGTSERMLSTQWFEKIYTQSGLELTPGRRILYFVLFFIIGWFCAFLFLNVPVAFEMVLAILSAFALSAGVILFVRARRIRKFVDQLAPAIEIIVRSLHAGHPLSAAIALVAREMPDPIGSEFGVLTDQLTFGAELETSMLNMYQRVGAEELKLLAVTVTVQRGTGGNLAEILENLAGMIRARTLLKRKIKAISAEGRITAFVMSAFPFLLFMMIRAMVSDYFDPLWDSGYGTMVVAGCLTMMSIGVFILYRLVNFDF